jgi:hypothetical protein
MIQWTKEETWSAHLSATNTCHVMHIDGGGYELQIEERVARRMLAETYLFPTLELAQQKAEEFAASGRKLERPWEIRLEHSHGGHMHTHEGGDVPHSHDPVSER